MCSEEAAFFTRPGRNVGKDLDTLDAKSAEQNGKEKTTDYFEEDGVEQEKGEKPEEDEKMEDYVNEVEKILDYLDEDKMMTENHGDL